MECDMMLNVLYSANDAYAPYLGVSLLSLLENNHTEYIYIYIES
jgi:lipopolysaccharide biosynthesis glycosyltransferase